MSKFTGWIKEHPLVAGGILLGGFLLFIILSLSGGSKAAPSTVVTAQPTSDTAQNTALQAAQLQAQVQSTAIAAQSATDQANIAASRDVALRNSDVSLANTYATADTSKYIATLGAQVENNKTEASKAINDANTSAAVQIANLQAITATTLGEQNRAIAFDTNAKNFAMASLAAGVATNQQNIDALNLQYQTTVASQNYDLGVRSLMNDFAVAQNNATLTAQKNANDYALGVGANNNVAQKNTYDFALGVQANQNATSVASTGQAYNYALGIQKVQFGVS